VVILRASNGLMALGVDGLTGAAAAVLRPLPQFAPGSKVIAGVSLDVEGVPQLVLEPHGLVESAQGWGPMQMASAEVRSAPLLVIDDSLTTRMLEQSILESAGYTVDTAVSAEEGLQKARERAYALFLVDVDMPGMDGFTFVQTVRADPDLRHTPAILVTSRASTQDRDKGKAVGANDYIAKGDFDQIAFLDCVRRLALPT
jgi:two-component system chemotaxis sensor kinase CheA